MEHPRGSRDKGKGKRKVDHNYDDDAGGDRKARKVVTIPSSPPPATTPNNAPRPSSTPPSQTISVSPTTTPATRGPSAYPEAFHHAKIVQPWSLPIEFLPATCSKSAFFVYLKSQRGAATLSANGHFNGLFARIWALLWIICAIWAVISSSSGHLTFSRSHLLIQFFLSLRAALRALVDRTKGYSSRAFFEMVFGSMRCHAATGQGLECSRTPTSA